LLGKTASAGSETLLLPLWTKLNDYNKATVAAKAATVVESWECCGR
jgi:hypothetical protein